MLTNRRLAQSNSLWRRLQRHATMAALFRTPPVGGSTTVSEASVPPAWPPVAETKSSTDASPTAVSPTPPSSPAPAPTTPPATAPPAAIARSVTPDVMASQDNDKNWGRLQTIVHKHRQRQAAGDTVLSPAATDMPDPPPPARPEPLRPSLDAVWPVQVMRTPDQSPPATSPTADATDKAQPVTLPETADSEQTIRRQLSQVAPPKQSDSSIELMLPSRPRPAKTTRGTLPPSSTSAPTPAATEKIGAAAEPPAMIATDVGPLPADLWQHLGQTPPQPESRATTDPPLTPLSLPHEPTIARVLAVSDQPPAVDASDEVDAPAADPSPEPQTPVAAPALAPSLDTDTGSTAHVIARSEDPGLDAETGPRQAAPHSPLPDAPPDPPSKTAVASPAPTPIAHASAAPRTEPAAATNSPADVPAARARPSTEINSPPATLPSPLRDVPPVTTPPTAALSDTVTTSPDPNRAARVSATQAEETIARVIAHTGSDHPQAESGPYPAASPSPVSTLPPVTMFEKDTKTKAVTSSIPTQIARSPAPSKTTGETTAPIIAQAENGVPIVETRQPQAGPPLAATPTPPQSSPAANSIHTFTAPVTERAVAAPELVNQAVEAETADIDVDELSRRVYRQLKRRLALEWERGHGR
jgi:hypothetical protein